MTAAQFAQASELVHTLSDEYGVRFWLFDGRVRYDLSGTRFAHAKAEAAVRLAIELSSDAIAEVLRAEQRSGMTAH